MGIEAAFFISDQKKNLQLISIFMCSNLSAWLCNIQLVQ